MVPQMTPANSEKEPPSSPLIFLTHPGTVCKLLKYHIFGDSENIPARARVHSTNRCDEFYRLRPADPDVFL